MNYPRVSSEQAETVEYVINAPAAIGMAACVLALLAWFRPWEHKEEDDE